MLGIVVSLAVALSLAEASAPKAREHVILLHGLCRTPRSMRPLEKALSEAGYSVHNIAYPSRQLSIGQLSDQYVHEAVTTCGDSGATKIHFVGHSLGAIVIRDYLSRHRLPNLGRVVMLAPPNQGSEVADFLRANFFYRWINGPAGQELGTDSASLPNRLGPVDYPVAVIAGDRTINWINSLIIPGADDGKVSVERTKLSGMAAHVVIHTAHPFIMRNGQSIRLILNFLTKGELVL